jgi:hypothetical protein
LLFDVELDVTQGCQTPFDTVLFAFVAEPGEKGELVQIPWTVVSRAIRIV